MIETPRLVLRGWREADREPFAAMMADPEVGYWMGGALTHEQSAIVFDGMRALLDEHGYGYWALARRADDALVGRIGLWRLPAGGAHPMSGEVEIGWCLARSAWGEGYATEAAGAALAWGFAHLDLDEVVSFTAKANRRSEAVMRRIGMTRAGARDFDHPALPEGHPLRAHVVYVARPARES